MRRIIISCLWVLVITNINGMEFEKADDHQKNNSMDIETSDSSNGGLKRLKEVEDVYHEANTGDACNEVKTFDYNTLLFLVSLHLSFEDRVTRLGVTCLDFRNIIISQITEIPEENLYSIIENDTLKAFTNLTNLNLEENDNITDKSLSCLTRLQTLDLTDNESITSCSLAYLTNLTSLRVTIWDNNSGIFGPVLETLPKLNDLRLEIAVFINYENLFGLTNLTRLETIYSCSPFDDYTDQISNNRFMIPNIWKHLPKLELYEFRVSSGNQPKIFETRAQFTKKQELRKKFLEEIKQENPYYSWEWANNKIEDLVKKHLENNG